MSTTPRRPSAQNRKTKSTEKRSTYTSRVCYADTCAGQLMNHLPVPMACGRVCGTVRESLLVGDHWGREILCELQNADFLWLLTDGNTNKLAPRSLLLSQRPGGVFRHKNSTTLHTLPAIGTETHAITCVHNCSRVAAKKASNPHLTERQRGIQLLNHRKWTVPTDSTSPIRPLTHPDRTPPTPSTTTTITPSRGACADKREREREPQRHCTRAKSLAPSHFSC